MHMTTASSLLLIIIFVPKTKSAIPGTFFWKPRLGIDLNLPTTEKKARALTPTKTNLESGLVVLIDGYEIGITIIAFAAGISSASSFLELNPMSAYYYTNVYRWGLRYISLFPVWFSGNDGNYCDTHRVWRRRFQYMDQFVPPWLRTLFPFVNKEEWVKEEREFKRFRKYAEPAFGKHYRYPKKVFDNFKSEITKETVENLDYSSASVS